MAKERGQHSAEQLLSRMARWSPVLLADALWLWTNGDTSLGLSSAELAHLLEIARGHSNEVADQIREAAAYVTKIR